MSRGTELADLVKWMRDRALLDREASKGFATNFGETLHQTPASEKAGARAEVWAEAAGKVERLAERLERDAARSKGLHGRVLLVRWLDAHGITPASFAAALSIDAMVFGDWLAGRWSGAPLVVGTAAAIEAVTGGAVPVLSWSDPEAVAERAVKALDRLGIQAAKSEG